MLVPFPIACFVGTLMTDLAYWKTAEMMWADFSAWLLLAGLVVGVLAAIAGLIDFLSNRLVRALAPASKRASAARTKPSVRALSSRRYFEKQR